MMAPPSPSGSAPILLKDQEPFALGGHRKVFVHPNHPDRCIKLWREDRTPAIMKAERPLHKRWRTKESTYDENLHEWKSLRALERHNNEEIWRFVPRCYGFAETDLGQGLVIELIKDHNGLISRTLFDYIHELGTVEPFRKPLQEFTAFWQSHTLANRRVLLYNIAAQEVSPGQYHLYLIDGFLSLSPFNPKRLFKGVALRKSVRQTQELQADITDLIEAKKAGRDPGELGFLERRE